MTDGDLEARQRELEAARAMLHAAQRRINDGIHELLNVLAIIKGEVDLAADRGRSLIDAFYERFPEFRDS